MKAVSRWSVSWSVGEMFCLKLLPPFSGDLDESVDLHVKFHEARSKGFRVMPLFRNSYISIYPYSL